ncbi:hypothetical protein B9G69_004675 [Bdellovibrio sp. SKB1291214]|uniref:hypothetical protein n=1 Tax=Bdellovibrio sp. SKB1291214 TaxID=1732569 RepID=UPI000B516287|nr:hypothetical protein [Bdellovibrio sp. SKB1291214]UYL09868.1 hypothetical protein B9G69_004675 [Bdellovibrio sp. SKB1291214]
MKILILFYVFVAAGCVSKSPCANSSDGFGAIYDPVRGCSIRVRQVVIGYELELPKSLDFNLSEVKWSYQWVETNFHNGVLELGHFALVPMGTGVLNSEK